MNAQPQEKLKITREEYLELERTSEIKHEYFNGEKFFQTPPRHMTGEINSTITG